MKLSLASKKISRAQARNAALLNQLATPGLGSLMARRWIAGSGQLLLFLAGFVIYCLWAVKNLSQYYNLMYSDEQPQGIGWNGLAFLARARLLPMPCMSIRGNCTPYALPGHGLRTSRARI